jgi:hypothetical protein
MVQGCIDRPGQVGKINECQGVQMGKEVLVLRAVFQEYRKIA